MEIEHGIFVVSLDFELYWGMRDKKTIKDYKDNLLGTADAISSLLELFSKYDIHATWAVTGLLFAHNVKEARKFSPDNKPGYDNYNLSPYDYIENNQALDTCYHFAPELIDKISKHEDQEVGTHTFSHYYCKEEGQILDEFDSDIECAMKIAHTKNISIKSLVFPRNQWNKEYLSILKTHNITSYRGNEKGWMYRDGDGPSKTLLKRMFILADTYFNLSGSNSYSLSEVVEAMPYNIPSSRFLRLVPDKYSFLKEVRKKRITNAIKQAAKKNEVFHLWWHPHNFGANLAENLKFLESILSYVANMKEQYGVQSLNMGEVSELVAGKV